MKIATALAVIMPLSESEIFPVKMYDTVRIAMIARISMVALDYASKITVF